ncbi:hypothetical protein WMY93_030883 [Mugilogobius chulae]|uniref:Uncharacterized protein n=1 Tax=Mugilogobius chulae TaxID=88201 RepID=A0AAW0MEY6_9GOBI
MFLEVGGNRSTRRKPTVTRENMQTHQRDREMLIWSNPGVEPTTSLLGSQSSNHLATMQSVMYELMSELNDRSEDLERQMLSLEQRVEQLTAGFNALPAHLSATLSAQHAALVHLLRERDSRDYHRAAGGGGASDAGAVVAVVPLSPASPLTHIPSLQLLRYKLPLLRKRPPQCQL